MKSNSQNVVDYSASLKIPLTASGIAADQKWIKEAVSEMAKRHSEIIEKAMLDALYKGTGVMYIDKNQTDDSTLYVCGVNCNGIKPSAADPLAQNMCPLRDAHCRVKAEDVRECYEPRAIDEQVAQEVKRLPGRKAYNQMWGLDDDPEEWQEEEAETKGGWPRESEYLSETAEIDKSTWDNLVQGQEQVQPEEETQERKRK